MKEVYHVKDEIPTGFGFAISRDFLFATYDEARAAREIILNQSGRRATINTITVDDNITLNTIKINEHINPFNLEKGFFNDVGEYLVIRAPNADFVNPAENRYIAGPMRRYKNMIPADGPNDWVR